MKFNIRSSYGNCDYRFVTVSVDSTTIDLGLLDAQQCKELAAVLREAADELYEIEEDQTNGG